jgi:hypothetical protein
MLAELIHQRIDDASRDSIRWGGKDPDEADRAELQCEAQSVMAATQAGDDRAVALVEMEAPGNVTTNAA